MKLWTLVIWRIRKFFDTLCFEIISRSNVISPFYLILVYQGRGCFRRLSPGHGAYVVSNGGDGCRGAATTTTTTAYRHFGFDHAHYDDAWRHDSSSRRHAWVIVVFFLSNAHAHSYLPITNFHYGFHHYGHVRPSFWLARKRRPIELFLFT